MKHMIMPKYCVLTMQSCAFCVLCLFVLLLPYKASAQVPDDAVFVSGNWIGKAHFKDDTGHFRSCTMSALYESGTEIYFVLNEKSEWVLGINNKKWNMKVDIKHTATIQIDQKPPVTGQAHVISPQGFYIKFTQSSNLLEDLKRGRHMIVYLREVRRYELKGTSMALQALKECAANRINVVVKPRIKNKSSDTIKAKSGGSDIPSPYAPGKKQKVSEKKRLEIIRLIEKHLVKQGTLDFSFIKAKKHPPDLDFDVMWNSPNRDWGGVKILTNSKEKNIDKIAGMIIAEDAGKCAGEFASVKKLVEQSGNASTRTITTVCRRLKGAQEIQYYLYADKNGSFVNIAESTTLLSVPGKFDSAPVVNQNQSEIAPRPQ